MKRQIKKTLAILLAVCFLISVTAVAVSAHQFNDHHKRGHHGGKGGRSGNIKSSADYKAGEIDGAQAGFVSGNADYTAALPYETTFNDVPSSISTTVHNKDNYLAGYADGYQRGYDKGFP
jgi:hypothetical protein